jgi:hypothetical protein
MEAFHDEEVATVGLDLCRVCLRAIFIALVGVKTESASILTIDRPGGFPMNTKGEILQEIVAVTCLARREACSRVLHDQSVLLGG